MVRIIQKYFSFILLVTLSFILTTGCSNTTEPEEEAIAEPQFVDITNRLPQSLMQTEAAGVYSLLAQVELGASFYDVIYSSVNENNNWSYSYSYQGLTVTYSAEAETRNNKQGTTWKWVYDGSFTAGDETLTYDDLTLWSGWTANDGSEGSYTWDYSVYSNVEGGSSTVGISTYVVNWSVNEDNTLAANMTFTENDETYTSTLTLEEDGSGMYTVDYPGTEDDESYTWDSDGNLVG
ncbi:MAG: hypothetical protein GF372_05260 [Candidatus Marinimicrobia bacterium]|nr:hypothetical protein [Candidatus Neomarinimicrobiota bacterium]